MSPGMTWGTFQQFYFLGLDGTLGTALAGHREQGYDQGHLALLVFNKNTLQAALQLPKLHARSEQEKGREKRGNLGAVRVDLGEFPWTGNKNHPAFRKTRSCNY